MSPSSRSTRRRSARPSEVPTSASSVEPCSETIRPWSWPGLPGGPSVTALRRMRTPPPAAGSPAIRRRSLPGDVAGEPQVEVDDGHAARAEALVERATQLGRERPQQGGRGLRGSARGRRRDAGGHPWPEQRSGRPGALRPATRERPLGEPRADDGAERDGDERSGRAKPRVVRPAARDPPPDGAQHGRRAAEREREHPGRAGIRARAPAVHQRHRPTGVGEPVHGAPRAAARAGDAAGS